MCSINRFEISSWSISFVLVTLIVFIANSCSNGQSGNIYSEYKWEDRDKWQKPELIIEQLGLDSVSYVADVGCHEGYMTVKLANHLSDSGKVFAVDVRTSRLSRLKEHLNERGIENVQVITGEYHDPKLPANELDAVLILDAYHEMDQYESILNHIMNSLKNNGRLVIVEPIRDSMRNKGRESQEERHEIGMAFVKEDLENAGFKIVKEMDPFIDRVKQKGDNLWLLVAVKDPKSSSTSSN